MKALVYDGPRQVSVKDVPTPRSSVPPTCWCASPPQTSAGRTCTCTRAVPTSRQAHDPEGNEHPNDTLNKLVKSVRFTGRIGSVGVFVPQDPGGSDELAKNGQVAFDYGMYWFKGQHIGSGQAPVKKYNRQLRDLIAAGKAEPSFIVSHELPLDQAPEAYSHFDARDDGWTKVVLKPALANA
jgi:glutathione-independent formaldehyde dehydrogenase